MAAFRPHQEQFKGGRTLIAFDSNDPSLFRGLVSSLDGSEINIHPALSSTALFCRKQAPVLLLAFAGVTLVKRALISFQKETKKRNKVACAAILSNFEDSHTAIETIRGGHLEETVKQNPLWPGGISQSDVDDLIADCLKDSSINIAAIPDYIERQIYQSTIKFTMNALYRSISQFHGKRFLGHEFRLLRRSRPRSEMRKELILLGMQGAVQEEMLKHVADKLIDNKYVDLPLIPDALERHIYVNCLKIIFRVLDLISISFKLTVCGHDISIQLEPSTRLAIQEAAFKRVSSSLTEIDMERMMDLARKSGIDSEEADRKRWFWQRIMSPSNNDFVAQIHASVFCLILGVLDDLLANTEIEILSDRIGFDIVPAPDDGADGTNIVHAPDGGSAGDTQSTNDGNSQPRDGTIRPSNSSSKLHLLVSFAAGVASSLLVLDGLR